MKRKEHYQRGLIIGVIGFLISIICTVFLNEPMRSELVGSEFNQYLSSGTSEIAQTVNEVTSDIAVEQSSILKEDVEVINGNVPGFTPAELAASSMEFEEYSELDDLGRCGVAFANISRVTIPTEERGEIGHIKPSGWHTVKYPGVVDGNYLYNRCHLIAYCLAGENANDKNLITGTRYLNNELMLPYELKVAKYMDANPDNHVLYRVTPVFEDENLIASYVQIEAYSVEDNGAGICFNVKLANIQPGVIIDYATGESKLED